MLNRSLTNLIAFLAMTLLAVAPGMLRSASPHPRWVLVRIGARPAEEDPGRQSNLSLRRIMGSILDSADSMMTLFGLIGILPIFWLIALYQRTVGPPADLRRFALAESGLCATWSGRAPPRL